MNGYTFLEIRDYLNTSDFMPQRTDNFSSQLVFGLFHKMNKRIKRAQKITPLRVYNFRLLHKSLKPKSPYQNFM